VRIKGGDPVFHHEPGIPLEKSSRETLEFAVSGPGTRERVVIVGAGFAGFHAAKTLSRLARGVFEIVILNPTDYFLYLPLLPEVTGGVLEPRRVAVPLASGCPSVRFVLGTAYEVDVEGSRVAYRDAKGDDEFLSYDRLVLSVGSVNKLLPIPGVAEHAYGFRSMAEAVYLRDDLLRDVEIASATHDPEERAARCTFVVVGAGYTGTEVAANGQLLTRHAAEQCPGLRKEPVRWLLIDIAQRIMPELDQRLSVAAHKVLTQRGVEVRTETAVAEASYEGVRLSTGEFVPTRTLIWCVGVRPDPLIESLGLPTNKGRLVVDQYLRVPGHPEIYSCGDAAAVPDLTRPGQLTGMTAQHAQRQGHCAGYNIAASHYGSAPRAYKHRDLGFVVDLGGAKAAANVMGLPLSGLPAKVVARSYHLLAVPDNRIRIATDWALDSVLARPAVQLGVVPAETVRLAATAGARPGFVE
jgi:NADH dehydrogenase